MIVSRIKQLREAKGMTQAQLASFINVSATTIQNLESDPEPLVKTLRLAAILGCKAEELIEDDGKPSDKSEKPTPDQLREIHKILERKR